jgi:hypothetical protein
MAGSAYQNAYNNYNNNQQNIYSRLGNLANLGQASGNNSSLGGSAFAGGMANTIVGAGNAQAAGQMGVANALSNGLSGAANTYALGNMFGGGSPSFSNFASGVDQNAAASQGYVDNSISNASDAIGASMPGFSSLGNITF